jgi:hypothetical protein
MGACYARDGDGRRQGDAHSGFALTQEQRNIGYSNPPCLDPLPRGKRHVVKLFQASRPILGCGVRLRGGGIRQIYGHILPWAAKSVLV